MLLSSLLQRLTQRELPAADLGFKDTGILKTISRSSDSGDDQTLTVWQAPPWASPIFYRIEPPRSLWFYRFINEDTEA